MSEIMEKQGVIAPGITPPENSDEKQVKKSSHKDAVSDLDNDFRKRAADAVRTSHK